VRILLVRYDSEVGGGGRGSRGARSRQSRQSRYAVAEENLAGKHGAAHGHSTRTGTGIFRAAKISPTRNLYIS
jgi:hypothetical protein